MALPRDPRQKMINFMYLVLTAMLALNVSTEILNAFKVVDTSLIKSNVVVDKSNKDIQASLDALLKDESNRANAAIWKPKADSAIEITNQVAKYIDGLKDTLLRESGYKPETGDTSFKEDDLDASSRLFGTDNKGEELKAALLKFREDVLNVLPAKYRAQLETSIPINVTSKEGQSFATTYFHMTPTVAALTMLSKFQSDVKRAGNLVAAKCLEQVGRVEFKIDKFQAFAGQSSEYLLPGQPITITAGLGAFSTTNLPSVSINGSAQSLDADGVANYKTTAEGAGEHTVNVVISYTNPNTNQKESTTKTIKYTVGTPSGASVFLEKMNVMYIGVDNPITISAGSIKRENMKVSMGSGSLSSAGGDRYIGRVTAQGNTTISVSGDGKSFSFPIRIKYLPDPVALVGTLKTGLVSAAQFRAMGGVRAVLENSDFEANFSVQGYTVGANCGGTYNEATVNGAQWGGNAVIASLKPGCLVWISNIRAVGPDQKPRKINDLTFRLQ
ncbi:MAG: gliding motility protein GldM [Chitinophagaceae bacterium]